MDFRQSETESSLNLDSLIRLLFTVSRFEDRRLRKPIWLCWNVNVFAELFNNKTNYSD